MRFTFFASIAITAASFATGGLAAPRTLASRAVQDADPVSRAFHVVQTMNDQVSAAKTAVGQTLSNITASSSAADKNAAAQQIAGQFSSLTTSLIGAVANLSAPASSAPAAAAKRQAASGPAPSTSDLINAINALATNIEGLLLTAIASTGDAGLIGPATAIITTFTGLLVQTLAVGVDFLPFLPDIASLVSSIGTLLSGIGAVIPKGA